MVKDNPNNTQFKLVNAHVWAYLLALHIVWHQQNNAVILMKQLLFQKHPLWSLYRLYQMSFVRNFRIAVDFEIWMPKYKLKLISLRTELLGFPFEDDVKLNWIIDWDCPNDWTSI